MLATLERGGIALETVCEKLVDDGVRLFADAADRLLGAVARKRAEHLGAALDRSAVLLPPPLEREVAAQIEAWRRTGSVRRLWARDGSLWTGNGEESWLDWLDSAAVEAGRLDALTRFAEGVRRDGFTHALLLGMGGSSLGPAVIAATFGRQPGWPELLVLDSTDPAQIRSVERRIDPAHTLFIVASKSGTTLEPDILMEYFLARAAASVGADAAGARFVAITDPGSKLQETAERHSFRHVFLGTPGIGGRYSVLSPFGLVPAAIMGLDVGRLLAAASRMVHSCDASVPPADNPGAGLGIILGEAAKAKRDKVTILTSPSLADFGAWLEQLLAESTGKHGHGIVPVDGEPLGPPAVYGKDRLFVAMSLAGEDEAASQARTSELAAAGHPVVHIAVQDRYHLGQEFFRWEMATSVAGSVLGIDPFDQPDVEASKAKTREFTSAFEKTGALPRESAVLEEDGIALFADAHNADTLAHSARQASLAGWLGAHFARLRAGDYAALLAYIERNPRHIEALQQIRLLIRDRKRVATCVGFGPRFLHSTGQVYKGGPNTGVFLQITGADAEDLPVPGRRYGFGVVKAAQARGDFAVLAERGRRVLRVHLGSDVEAGLATLTAAIRRAFA